jgi:hypothetical protein
MNKRRLLYILVVALIPVDSLLLASPNLLGKIGLFIYKYHYLRTFPRTLLTVSMAIVAVLMINELIRFMVGKEVIKRSLGSVALFLLLLLSAAALLKTFLDFSTWTYGHTGARFRYGAYLLPLLWMMITMYHLINLPKPTNGTLAVDERTPQ